MNGEVAADGASKGVAERRGVPSIVLELVLRLGWAYALLNLALMSLEDRFVFPRGDWNFPAPVGLRHDDVTLVSEDGARLHAWYCHAESPAPDEPVVLYCHGNASNLSRRVRHGLAQRWSDHLGADLFIFDYRGYGRSEFRTPTVAGVQRDARAAYEYLTVNRKIDPSRILIVGESLGGAVAIELAKSVPHRALVIERSFARLDEIAWRCHPYLFTSVMMRNHWPSETTITEARSPVFISHGTADRLIPIEHAERLLASAPAPKELHLWPGLDHHAMFPPSHYTNLGQFLAREATNARLVGEQTRLSTASVSRPRVEPAGAVD